ncbi:MAG: hypothetical protein KAS66_05155 [Candidatus Omnitrophica bacterium]|nr:hypothetical protein [Candidatus Omnitrophota bacterium]
MTNKQKLLKVQESWQVALDFMEKTGMRPSRLALNAGLSKNTLRGVDMDKLPSGSTLLALEQYIRKDKYK